MFKRLRHIIVFVILLVSTGQAIAQIAMPDNVCVGTTRTYSVNTVSPPVGSTYTWKIDGVAQATTTNEITITWNTPGTYLLEVQEFTAGGCYGDVQSGQVFVNANVTPSVSVSASATTDRKSVV